MESIVEVPLWHNHISPSLCQELRDCGFPVPSSYFWKIYPSDAVLATNAFDIDNYYEDAQGIIDKLVPVSDTFPAWTIRELERHLPDFYISRVGKEYTLAIDDIYNVSPVTASRMVDLFAMMLLKLIRYKMVKYSK